MCVSTGPTDGLLGWTTYGRRAHSAKPDPGARARSSAPPASIGSSHALRGPDQRRGGLDGARGGGRHPARARRVRPRPGDPGRAPPCDRRRGGGGAGAGRRRPPHAHPRAGGAGGAALPGARGGGDRRPGPRGRLAAPPRALRAAVRAAAVDAAEPLRPLRRAGAHRADRAGAGAPRARSAAHRRRVGAHPHRLHLRRERRVHRRRRDPAAPPGGVPRHGAPGGVAAARHGRAGAGGRLLRAVPRAAGLPRPGGGSRRGGVAPDGRHRPGAGGVGGADRDGPRRRGRRLGHGLRSPGPRRRPRVGGADGGARSAA